MSIEITRKHTLETKRNPKEKEKPNNNGFLSKQLKKVYPVCFLKSTSPLSLSSLSLNSNDSCQTDTNSLPLDQKIYFALRRIAPPVRREYKVVTKNGEKCIVNVTSGELGRCNWITKNSDKTYVQFHDDCWGVPIYDDNQLFEMLAMSGMLMEYNWTEILKRKESVDLHREAFYGFDPNDVAKMGENEITEIISNKEFTLSETRVRCIIDNAKCMLQIVREYGSFSNFIWEYVNFKPVINKFKYPRNVPLRSPKAEIISKDLLKRGFRFVGPVIVYSFMKAAGLTIDHLVDCYRFSECVSLAERPWRHV